MRVWWSLPVGLSDDEWGLIEDLVPSYTGGAAIGRPAKWGKREIVNAVLCVMLMWALVLGPCGVGVVSWYDGDDYYEEKEAYFWAGGSRDP